MKKGDIIEGIITRTDFPNKGIMTADDTVCMVKNTIPGQKVQGRVKKKRNGKAELTLLEVLEKAPDEREAPCRHFGTCGGCTYLHLEYEKECRLKEEQVLRLLRQADPDADSWFEGIKKSPREYGYRNKMEFSFGDETKDGPLSLGMHKRGSFYDIVTVSDCRIVDADYRSILTAVRDYFGDLYDKKEITFYHRLRHEGYLRHLLVRKASHTGEILIDLVTTSQETHDLAPLRDTLLALPLEGTIIGILHTTNDAVADIIRDEGTEILFGRDYFYEELLGLRFKVTPFSFFQTNSYGAEVLYETARSYMRDAGLKLGSDRPAEANDANNDNDENAEDSRKPVVYDLYCGTGTITQLMAPAASKVIGVEIVEEAVEAAKENAKRNGLDNCEFVAGDVLKVIDEVAQNNEKPDMIILDPPRDGIHPKALPKILDFGVDSILYISCKPTSLARDLPAFLEAGYRVQKGVCVDQFPWTANVESVCLLSRHKKVLTKE